MMMIMIKQFLQSLFAFNPPQSSALQALEEHKPHLPHSCTGKTQGGEEKVGSGVSSGQKVDSHGCTITQTTVDIWWQPVIL